MVLAAEDTLFLVLHPCQPRETITTPYHIHPMGAGLMLMVQWWRRWRQCRRHIEILVGGVGLRKIRIPVHRIYDATRRFLLRRRRLLWQRQHARLAGLLIDARCIGCAVRVRRLWILRGPTPLVG